MVMEAERARRRNPELPVMTNLGRLDLTGAPCELLADSRDMQDALDRIADFKGGYLLLDEVGVYLPARVWNKMPAELGWKWQQLRKDGVELRWTCIRPANVVKDLRDITWETGWCTSMKRLGFFMVAWYSYCAVGDQKFYQARTFFRMNRATATRLYDTTGKVEGALFDGHAFRGVSAGETLRLPSEAQETGLSG